MQPFQFFSPPHLDFGAGHIDHLPSHILAFGHSALIIKGGQSLEQSGYWQRICQLLKDNAISWSQATISGEPSPSVVDTIVADHRQDQPDCVIAIGGGSVIDAGKAVSAMLTCPGSVKNYLEKVGNKAPENKRIPFIAIPTTSGTGSEATKNAVLSEVGPQGYKASLRHDSYIPNIALIDPELMIACPPHVTAAAGMDALSQLLESYLSTAATPLTDAMALSGLEHFSRSFPAVCSAKAGNPQDRANMAYTAYLSGLTLANAGLGTVHGIAGVIGGYKQLPHGEICGVLLAPVMEQTLAQLKASDPALEKMSRAASILTRQEYDNPAQGANAFIKHLRWLQRETTLTHFKDNSITGEDINTFAKSSDNKNNPVKISYETIKSILTGCIIA